MTSRFKVGDDNTFLEISDSGFEVSVGLSVTLQDGGATLQGNPYAYHYLTVPADSIDGTDAGGSKVNSMFIWHKFGGASAKGGRHAHWALCTQTAATASDNPDRNYVGAVGQCITQSGDGGTSGSVKGGYFGGNFYGRIDSGATFAHNVTGAEFNAGIQTGGSCDYRSGLQIAGVANLRGSVFDAAISVGNVGAAPTWKTGVLFSNAHGPDALGTDSNAIEVSQTGAIDTFAKITTQVTSKLLDYTNGAVAVQLSGSAFELATAAAHVDLGRPSSSSTPFVEFHSSGNSNVYDSRIVASGGSGSDGQGILNFQCASGIFFGAVQVSNTSATITAGTGSPEGTVTAVVGSLFVRTDGGAGTTLYVKESGTSNTGWVAK